MNFRYSEIYTIRFFEVLSQLNGSKRSIWKIMLWENNVLEKHWWSLRHRCCKSTFDVNKMKFIESNVELIRFYCESVFIEWNLSHRRRCFAFQRILSFNFFQTLSCVFVISHVRVVWVCIYFLSIWIFPYFQMEWRPKSKKRCIIALMFQLNDSVIFWLLLLAQQTHKSRKFI